MPRSPEPPEAAWGHFGTGSGRACRSSTASPGLCFTYLVDLPANPFLFLMHGKQLVKKFALDPEALEQLTNEALGTATFESLDGVPRGVSSQRPRTR